MCCIAFIALINHNIYKGGCLLGGMFEWLFGSKYKALEQKTQDSFIGVKKDMETAGKWIKHLETQDKQLFASIQEIKRELSSIRDELGGLREAVQLQETNSSYEQVLVKQPTSRKQPAVARGSEGVQTAVQTGNFYQILKSLTANERLLIFTLAQSDMKLSYEDLALLLGKERATIRGQINAIKQKREGLLCELSEKNGKKRVFVPEEVRNKLAHYAKVRVVKGEKPTKKAKSDEQVEESLVE